MVQREREKAAERPRVVEKSAVCASASRESDLHCERSGVACFCVLREVRGLSKRGATAAELNTARARTDLCVLASTLKAGFGRPPAYSIRSPIQMEGWRAALQRLEAQHGPPKQSTPRQDLFERSSSHPVQRRRPNKQAATPSATCGPPTASAGRSPPFRNRG